MSTDLDGNSVPWERAFIGFHVDSSGSISVLRQSIKKTAKIECEVTFEPPPMNTLQNDKLYQERPGYYKSKSVRSNLRAVNEVLQEMQTNKSSRRGGLLP